MENHAITWLNENLAGIGTFFALIFFVLTIVNAYTNIRSKVSNRIRNETIEDEEFRKLKDSVNTLITSVENIKQSVDNINDKLIDTDNKFTDNIEKNTNKINTLEPKLNELEKHVNEMEAKEQKALDNIAEYNKLAIKSFIMTEYRKWMELGHIDIYQLSIIENQYKIYEDVYKGNTFVAETMNQLRKLSAQPVILDESGNDPIRYFETHPDRDPRNHNGNS